MLILLPPSETKSDSGTGGALDLAALALPDLTPAREAVVDALVGLADDPDAPRVLGLGSTQSADAVRNAEIRTSPTAPALERYTGVLYDAFAAPSLTRAGRARAADRLWIGSALFGAVRATDPVPWYRLSGGTTLPGLGTLRSHWKPHLGDALAGAAQGVVVDLRSGVYQDLGPVPGAVTATVVTEKPDGSRSVVSHFNKHHKGLLARALTTTRAEPTDVRGLARVARAAGLRVEVTSPTLLTVVT
ncbi:peroxide stress protein YaaA [Rhodococcoides corynebacterioides]|uniref:peroxide stress protein YaaA n=1 Tax=Rhodococcoides corynebacterioides TaxID=53972 RepID=UPI003F7F6B2B